MARFRLPQRRLDRVLPVAALLLCAGLLLLPLREEPYTETPFAERMEAVPETWMNSSSWRLPILIRPIRKP